MHDQAGLNIGKKFENRDIESFLGCVTVAVSIFFNKSESLVMSFNHLFRTSSYRIMFAQNQQT